MTSLRTITLTTLLAAGTTLAYAGRDCSMTADGDDLVAPPIKSAKVDAKEDKAQLAREAQRQMVAVKPAAQRTAATTKAAETKKP